MERLIELKIEIVTGEKAEEIELYAAKQLGGYISKLFGIIVSTVASMTGPTDAVFILGTSGSNALLKKLDTGDSFSKLNEQAFVLRKMQLDGKQAFIICGGSARAVMWGVYELVEKWGVRYLLHRDVLPEMQEFYLPDMDIINEPVLPIRVWRVINDFVNGFEGWGIHDYRVLFDQLAKLKFNRILLYVWAWQPFLDLEISGIKRKEAWLWYGYRYPITDDMIGREHFGNEKEFWHRDLPVNAPYEEFAAAGKKFMHDLMALAHSRGMECMMTVSLFELPPEFSDFLGDVEKADILGKLTVVPGLTIRSDDKRLEELAACTIKAAYNTYPEVDYLVFHMPELPQWYDAYEDDWKMLDRKYGLEEIYSLENILKDAQIRGETFPGGLERVMKEVKGNIVRLNYFDRLLNDSPFLKDIRIKNKKYVFNGIAEELVPVIDRVLGKNCELMLSIDYTPTRVLRRKHVFEKLKHINIPWYIVQTLEDDNIGIILQLTTGSVYEIMKEAQNNGCLGFVTRLWNVEGHNLPVSYLAKASWRKSVTPGEIYCDQLKAVSCENCMEEMLEVFRIVEETTAGLEWHGLFISFPVPCMLMDNWKDNPALPEILADRERYRVALSLAKKALKKLQGQGYDYVEYWVGRLEFTVNYLDAYEYVTLAGMAEHAGRYKEALEFGENAQKSGVKAAKAHARIVHDQSDRGMLAHLNENVIRALWKKLEGLRMEVQNVETK